MPYALLNTRFSLRTKNPNLFGLHAVRYTNAGTRKVGKKYTTNLNPMIITMKKEIASQVNMVSP